MKFASRHSAKGLGVRKVNDSETLLVVDDEPAILTLMWRLLRADGYTANWASGASQAMEGVQAIPTPIDLLVTDVVMPGMSGFELATRIQTQYPETKVLFLTGYVRTWQTHNCPPFYSGIMAIRRKSILHWARSSKSTSSSGHTGRHF